jgi:hypothetical protein
MKLSTFIILLFCVGCKPMDSISVPNTGAIQQSTDSINVLQSKQDSYLLPMKTDREYSSDKYGKNKIDTFISECLKKYPSTRYHGIVHNPHDGISGAIFRSKHGDKIEIVVSVSKPLQNRFNEEYNQVFECEFYGAPLWEMHDQDATFKEVSSSSGESKMLTLDIKN